MIFRKKEPEVIPPRTMPTETEWNKSIVEPTKVAAVINSDTDTGFWEKCNEDPTLWDRQLKHLLPLVTNERAPDDIPS